MSFISEYAMVIVILLVILYAVIKQIKLTLLIRKNNSDSPYYNSMLWGNVRGSIFSVGFLSSYVLNFLAATEIIQTQLITTNGTALGCLVFLLLIIVNNHIFSKNRYELNKL